MLRSALPSRPCARSAKCRAQQAMQRPTAPAATGSAMSDCASRTDAAPLLHAAQRSWLLIRAGLFFVMFFNLAEAALRPLVLIFSRKHASCSTLAQAP